MSKFECNNTCAFVFINKFYELFAQPSYNYARVILSKNGMRRMAPPDFLFKHRIQTCKCHNYSHHLSKKYPMYNML